MSTPFGQGIQYPHPVQPTFTVFCISSFTSFNSSRSESVIQPGRESEAVFKFSSTISMEFIPDRTQVTSGWSYSHLKASSAGVWLSPLWLNRAFADSGSRFTRRPPRRGSMTMTGSPFALAYFKPSTPAWEVSSI